MNTTLWLVNLINSEKDKDTTLQHKYKTHFLSLLQQVQIYELPIFGMMRKLYAHGQFLNANWESNIKDITQSCTYLSILCRTFIHSR